MKKQRNLMKSILSGICLLLFAFSVSGQEAGSNESAVKKMQYGIKIGATLSSFSAEQPHTNIKSGIIVGVFASYKLSDLLAIQLEPSYMQQGGNLTSIFDPTMDQVGEYDFPFSMQIKDQKVTFHNIDVPLLLKVEKTISGLQFFGVVGPGIGVNFHAFTKNEVTARSSNEYYLTKSTSAIAAPIPESTALYQTYYEEENITSNIETLQWGLTGGLGFETSVGKHSLIVDARYRYGLNKTYKGYSYLDIYQVQGDMKTNSFYVTIGLGF